MLRRALTYQLILAVAVGPLLCCCTAGRLLAKSVPQTPAAPAPVPVKTALTCCAHKKAAHSEETPTASDSKPAPSKPGDKCPCHDPSGKVEKIAAEAAAVDVSAALRSLSLGVLAPFAVFAIHTSHDLTITGWSFIRRPGATGLSASDLLYVHHNLRC